MSDQSKSALPSGSQSKKKADKSSSTASSSQQQAHKSSTKKSQQQTAAEAAAGSSSSDRTVSPPISASSSNKSHQKQHKQEKQDPKPAAKGKALSSKRKAATSKQSVVAPDKNQGSSDSDTPSKRIKRRDSESSVESELHTHPSDVKQSSSSKKRSHSTSSDDSIPSPQPVRTTRGAARRTRSQDTAAEQHQTAGSSSGVGEKRVKGGKGSKKPKEEEVKEEPQEDSKHKVSSSTASGRGQRKGQQKKGKEPVKKEESSSEEEEEKEESERHQHFVGHQLTGLINHFPDVEVAPGTRITRATTRRNPAFKDPSSTASSTPTARTPDLSHPHQSAPLDVAKTGQSISSSSGSLSAATNQNRAGGSRDRAATGPSSSAASTKRKRKTSELSATAAAASVRPSASAAAIKTEPESSNSGFGETFAAGGAQSSASLNTGTCASSTSCVGRGLRSNSVCPQAAGSANNNTAVGSTGAANAEGGSAMASGNNNNSSGGSNEGIFNDLTISSQQSQDSDHIEMNRLQALLEARGLPGQLFSALGPRMHSLLHRPSNNPINSKIQGLLTAMQSVGDESAQLQAAIEVCQLLVMGNEETLGSQFPIKPVTQALMALLAMEHNFDIMNHACRALTYMMEALPRSTPVVADAIPLFVEKLQRIECMDVAEQSLTALEMLSRRHSKNILTSGGVMACLTYVDFFAIIAQRCALQIAANCCYHLNNDEFHYIADCLGMLTQRLSVPDKKSAECVCTCFTRLVDNFQLDEAKIRQIAGHGLLTNIQNLLVMAPPVLSTNSFVAVIRMLHIVCGICPELAVQLLKQDFAATLRFLLLGTTEPLSGDFELLSRTPQEVHEIVCLIGELMPRLPSDGIFSVDSLLRRTGPSSADAVVWQWKDDRAIWRPYTAIDSRILEAAFQSKEDEISLNIMGQTYTVDFHGMVQINESTGNSRSIQRRLHPAAGGQTTNNNASSTTSTSKTVADPRAELANKEPEIIEKYVTSLFAILYEVFSSSAGPAVRHECLRAMLRMIYNCTSDVLKDLLKNLSLSSSLANMLSSQDLKIVVSAVQLSRILLTKLPDIYVVFFRREGVIHQLEKLVNMPSGASSPAKPGHGSGSASAPVLLQPPQAFVALDDGVTIGSAPSLVTAASVDRVEASLANAINAAAAKEAARGGIDFVSHPFFLGSSQEDLSQMTLSGGPAGGRGAAASAGANFSMADRSSKLWTVMEKSPSKEAGLNADFEQLFGGSGAARGTHSRAILRLADIQEALKPTLTAAASNSATPSVETPASSIDVDISSPSVSISDSTSQQQQDAAGEKSSGAASSIPESDKTSPSSKAARHATSAAGNASGSSSPSKTAAAYFKTNIAPAYPASGRPQPILINLASPTTSPPPPPAASDAAAAAKAKEAAKAAITARIIDTINASQAEKAKTHRAATAKPALTTSPSTEQGSPARLAAAGASGRRWSEVPPVSGAATASGAVSIKSTGGKSSVAKETVAKETGAAASGGTGGGGRTLKDRAEARKRASTTEGSASGGPDWIPFFARAASDATAPASTAASNAGPTIRVTRSQAKAAATGGGSASGVSSKQPSTHSTELRKISSSLRQGRHAAADASAAASGKSSGSDSAAKSNVSSDANRSSDRIGFFSSLPLPRWARPSGHGSASNVSSASQQASVNAAAATSAAIKKEMKAAVSKMSVGSAERMSDRMTYYAAQAASAAAFQSITSGGGGGYADRLAMQLPSHYLVSGSSFASSNAQTTANKEKIRAWIKEQAKEIIEKYFSDSIAEGSADGAIPNGPLSVLHKLMKITEMLNVTKGEWLDALCELKTIVMESDVSPFEIHHSGLISALIWFLTATDEETGAAVGWRHSKSARGGAAGGKRLHTGGDNGGRHEGKKSSAKELAATIVEAATGGPEAKGGVSKETESMDWTPSISPKATQRAERLRQFCAVFLNVTVNDFKVSFDMTDTPALSSFVAKLNACVTQIEQFPVKVHELPGGPGGALRGTNALRFFHSHQIKCMLRRHNDCTNLRQWKRGPVKIDPLAQISSIERYMVMKGFGRVVQDDDDETSDDDGSDEDLEEALLNLAGATTGARRIQFLINDHVLPPNMTIYQAVRQFGMSSGPAAGGGPGAQPVLDMDAEAEMNALGYAAIWVNTHTLSYRLLPTAEQASGSEGSPAATAASKESSPSGLSSALGGVVSGLTSSLRKKSPQTKADLLWNEGITSDPACPLSPLLKGKFPDSAGLNDPSLDCLCLLRVLNAINRYWWTLFKDCLLPSYNSIVPAAEFFNQKLTAKANRQLQDPLVIMTGNLPSWLKQLAYACPFLFPFETRQLLFYVVVFDRDRALQRLLDMTPDLLGSADTHDRITPRLDKRKCTIQRDDMLKQAEQIINDVGPSRATLEIQYKDEVGTGLGPTLEFYALISKELQKAELEMWRGEKVKVPIAEEKSTCSVEYVFNQQGLYPIALPHHPKPALLNKLKSKFKFMGKFMARGLMDSRMLDLPHSSVFYKWLLSEEKTLSLADIAAADKSIHRSLQYLLRFVQEKKKIMADQTQTPESRQVLLDSITVDNACIEDMDLDFTLPGAGQIELKKGGKDTPVTIENVDLYIKLVSHWLLAEGVQKQMEAVREGFESVLSLHHLKMFYPDELDQLFCGSVSGADAWDPTILAQCIKPDHGYTHDSPQIQWLIETMASFNGEDQRHFLQFVTGCPKLPVGGFKTLSPTLTVVRRTLDASENPDKYLPSVMTCVNYLKLPEYSSVAIMRTKLGVAIREGQKCFHLS